jgi:hypothetical protein
MGDHVYAAGGLRVGGDELVSQVGGVDNRGIDRPKEPCVEPMSETTFDAGQRAVDGKHDSPASVPERPGEERI